MEFRDHLRTTGGALKNWFIAQLLDALVVGALWLVGLLIIGVTWAPLWAVLAALFQFVPNLGAVLGLIGPAMAAALSGKPERALYVLILYAVIAAVDGFWLQPYLMKRTSRVPIWASILAPIALGFIIPFWGILLAPPLLAVIYAYRGREQNLLAVDETQIENPTLRTAFHANRLQSDRNPSRTRRAQDDKDGML